MVTQYSSEFDDVSKSVITLLAHGRDCGSADFWIRLDSLQKPSHTLEHCGFIFWIGHSTTENDVVHDLDMLKVSDSRGYAGPLVKYARLRRPCVPSVWRA